MEPKLYFPWWRSDVEGDVNYGIRTDEGKQYLVCYTTREQAAEKNKTADGVHAIDMQDVVEMFKEYEGLSGCYIVDGKDSHRITMTQLR